MTSVDEIFKLAGSSSGKRKLNVSHDPSHYYKSSKVGLRDAPGARSARVEDDEDLEAGPELPPDETNGEPDDDMEAGPELPPEDELDEDEEGRFFGSGVNTTTRAAIDLVDQVEGKQGAGPDPVLIEEKRDSQWVRRLTVSLKKKIASNSTLRTKYPNEPLKFIQSEADLDDELRNITILAENTEHYEEFAELGGVTALMGLLVHENADIVLRAIEVLVELTDEDVEATANEWDAIINSAVDADLIELLRDTLVRIDDTKEDAAPEDIQGVDTVLSLLEVLASRGELVERIGQTSGLLEWIVRRITTPEPAGKISANKMYAAEILSILCHSDLSAHLRARLIDREKLNAVDAVLTILARYRKSDPPADQEDFSANLFSVLQGLLDPIAGKQAFLSCQGVELMVIMLREGGKEIKRCATATLYHALDGCGESEIGPQIAQEIIECGGLAVLFSLFMKATRSVSGDATKKEKKRKRNDSGIDQGIATNWIPILFWLLTLLPVNSDGRLRLLAKLVERDYEKTVQLVRVRRYYQTELSRTDERIEREKRRIEADKERRAEEGGEAEDEDEEDVAVRELGWYQDRITGGLHGLRMVDQVLVWAGAEDVGARAKIEEELKAASDSADQQTPGKTTSTPPPGWAQVLAVLEELKGEIGLEDERATAAVTVGNKEIGDEEQREKERRQQDAQFRLSTLDALIDVVKDWM